MNARNGESLSPAQHIARIKNDLSRLIPLGVLYFTNLPIIPSNGLKVHSDDEDQDDWMWLDLPYTNTREPIYSAKDGSKCVLSPIALDLSYLLERSLIQATHKFIKVGGLRVVVVRVYWIPSDIEGNRFLETFRSNYRRGKPLNWHESKQKTILENILNVMDFSDDNWNRPELIRSKLLLFSAIDKFVPFSSGKLAAGPYLPNETLKNHITRLLNGESYHNSSLTKIDETLENRLTNIYHSIKLDLDMTSDYLTLSQDIPGVKSRLYNYQMESISKMYSNETDTRLKVMPHLIKITKFNGTFSFYFNKLTMTFRRDPEYYTTPRGGILAENMGLGKTLICLALICLTKYESSETPDKYTMNNVRDYKLQSLFDQCIRHVNRHSIPWGIHKDSLPSTCIDALEKSPGFFYVKTEELPRRGRPNRGRPVVEKKYLLTSATLIVCPDNLFKQWAEEIAKHIKPGFLSIYYTSANSPLPPPTQLASYDVVLMPISVYSREDLDTSVLGKIYWKRFIIDEGHSMNQRSSRSVDLSKNILFERKWAVTGTPTAGMTNLHMNETFDDDSKSYDIKRAFNARDDLKRLGYLIANFFQIEPWASDNLLWNNIIIKPLTNNDVNSNESLKTLLNSIIVRHSTDQIDTDVTLPPLHHKPVFLTPSYHNKLSVNIFTAVLAVNAVSSEREDQDYMFHPDSKADLRRLVTNLQRSTFYWTGFSNDDLDSMIYIANVCLEKTKEDGSQYYSLEDTRLLERSIRACKVALADKNWRTVSTLHEMNYFVYGLNDLFKKNYAINKLSSEVSVFGAPQLYALQSFYFKNRFAKDEALQERITQSSDEFWKSFWKEATKKNAERVKKNDGQTINVQKVNEELELQEKLSLKSNNKSKFDDPNFMKSSNGRIQTALSNSSSPEPSVKNNQTNKFAKMLGTSSAKLSYMVSKLLEDSFEGVKSIIFFEFEDSAYYLSEALDLIGVDYTLYATSVPKEERSERIKSFTESKGAHTLIMDLKLASHGLTIIAATKVYFLNPVWKRSVEAQAIKRAHRIGQTSPVHVETLILKGTLEEEMYKRRLKSEDESNLPVADDDHIRNYISKFEFLKTNDQIPYTDFKCRTTSTLKSINKKEFEDFELHEPSALGIKSHLYWDIPLFSKNALSKQSELQKNHTIDKKSIKVDETVSKSPNKENKLTTTILEPLQNDLRKKSPKPNLKDNDEQDTKPPKKKIRFV